MSGQVFALIVIFGSMFWIYAMARTGVRKQDHRYNEEETEIIQELHRGLEKMGARIEALETLLLDQNEKYRRTPPPVPRESVDRY